VNKQRFARLGGAMRDAGLDALFVSNPKNVLYLAGFKTLMPGEVQPFGDPEAFALVTADDCHILCDGRYIEGAKQLRGVTPQLIESPTNARIIAEKIKTIIGEGKRCVGFERDALLYGDAVSLLEFAPDIDWKPAENVLAELRVIKSADEIASIRKAQAITDACFQHIRHWIRPGLSERQVALEIDGFLRIHSEGNSFNPIVAFGETACNPHYIPSPTRKLEANQLVLLDCGSIHDGYCGDMTRMLYVGKADNRYREVYHHVLQAQLRCLGGVGPGRTCHDLDALCRDYFKDHGCEKAFMHGTGHGVGLAIHEDPRIKPTFQNAVRPGMVFTVEPGLYYAGWGGIRIEDMVVVTDSGYENLTTTTKDLIELDA